MRTKNGLTKRDSTTVGTSIKRSPERQGTSKDDDSLELAPKIKKLKAVASATTKKGRAQARNKKSPLSEETSDESNSGPWYTVFTKNDTEYMNYMKNEWGFEKRGDEAMFEKLSLEGAQAGLSWLTILRKREAYRTTFFQFDIDKVATMTQHNVQAILDTPKTVDTRNVVVKHRGKIEAVIHNAKCIQQMRQEAAADQTHSAKTKSDHGVFDDFLWSFVDDKPIVNGWWHGRIMSDCPSTSPESNAMSKALRDRGFKFVGPTTCYSMMQAYGMVIDHPVGSPEYEEAIERLKKRPGGYQMRKK